MSRFAADLYYLPLQTQAIDRVLVDHVRAAAGIGKESQLLTRDCDRGDEEPISRIPNGQERRVRSRFTGGGCGPVSEIQRQPRSEKSSGRRHASFQRRRLASRLKECYPVIHLRTNLTLALGSALRVAYTCNKKV